MLSTREKGIDIAPSMIYIVVNRSNRVNTKFLQNFAQLDKVASLPKEISNLNDDELVIPSSVKFEPLFKGYTQGVFHGDVDSVKDSIIRFRVVNVDEIGIIFGWQDNKWITAQPTFDYEYLIREVNINQFKMD
ncbi:MAG: hypothetical protein EZS28_031701 [Streblomastix strix]|uniref:Uncharacterized protein n=1 Tax=Streblomastix strix TaxID=222440 RepID=A0A5J4URG6_9EUKA|nr:MAG: hypothetical protein EZS28_031701 [Streblomastix strix]